MLEHYSYFGIIVFLVLTGAGLPIPEELAIVYAGLHSAAPAGLVWQYAWLSCMVGAMLGDTLMYWIGFHFGRSVLREHPWYTGFLTPDREKQIETTIRKHGLKAFFLARFMVGVRGPMYITAGILHVPYRRFLIADAISASLVVTLFFSLAYFFGERVSSWISRGTHYLTAFVAVLIVVGLIAWYVKNRRKAKAFVAADGSPNTDQDAASETSNQPETTGDSADSQKTVA